MQKRADLWGECGRGVGQVWDAKWPANSENLRESGISPRTKYGPE